jgi:hypothetical protein
MNAERIRGLAALAASETPSTGGRAEQAISAMPPAMVRAVLVEALLLIGRTGR